MHNLKVDEAVKDALHWAVCETGNRAVVWATKGAEPGDPEHLISADFLHSAELA